MTFVHLYTGTLLTATLCTYINYYLLRLHKFKGTYAYRVGNISQHNNDFHRIIFALFTCDLTYYITKYAKLYYCTTLLINDACQLTTKRLNYLLNREIVDKGIYCQKYFIIYNTV